jgi:tryptophan-rich sensory protein
MARFISKPPPPAEVPLGSACGDANRSPLVQQWDIFSAGQVRRGGDVVIRKYLAWTATATGATAALGSVASSDTSTAWYRQLRKPAIQPPAAVFPVVWTVLYSDIAVTSAVALDRLPGDEAEIYKRALAANLVLNASWSWVFFKAHRLFPAILVAAALSVSSWDLVARTLRGDKRAGWALLPYAGWCSFATVLTSAIWWRNR